MSELRKHLGRARDRHRRARYPGDLAAELLRPRTLLKAVVAQAGVLTAALAAVVLLAVRLSRAPVEIDPEPVPLAAMEPQPGVALVFPALDLPRAPVHVTSIETPSLSFATPSFPAVQPNVESKSTTKETT